MPHLLSLMLKEEYRMHVSLSSKRAFLSIPVFIFLIALIMALTITNLEGTMSMKDVLTNVNAGVFLYGLSVGAFGFLGKTYVERRQGRQNFLIAAPSLLPMSYKRTFLGMFLRDTIFYLLMMLVPLLLAMLAAIPLVHFSLVSILVVFISLMLSFLLGISLSFAVSVIGTWNRAVFVAIIVIILCALLGFGVFHLYGLDTLVPSIGFQYNAPPIGAFGASSVLFISLSIISFLVLTSIAVMMVAESYEGRGVEVEQVYPSYLPRFKFAGYYRPFMAKEFVDIKRSGAIGKMLFTYIAPLTFLSFTTWYVNNGLSIPVGFNIVFYAAMIGFFSVMLYSWLTNIDVVDYFETLPVSVPTIIRTKIFTFFFLTAGISTGFLIAISLLNNETQLLWLALPVLYIMSIYSVVATAYLTGLHPNSFLFNPQVLTRFTVISIVPDICLTILSFSVGRSPAEAMVGIVSVLVVLSLCTILFYRRLDVKWSGSGFT